jgi:hypothetical protein
MWASILECNYLSPPLTHLSPIHLEKSAANQSRAKLVVGDSTGRFL